MRAPARPGGPHAGASPHERMHAPAWQRCRECAPTGRGRRQPGVARLLLSQTKRFCEPNKFVVRYAHPSQDGKQLLIFDQALDQSFNRFVGFVMMIDLYKDYEIL